MTKANMRNLAARSKQDLIIKKRLLREKNEKATCGDYDLIYPFVTYAEEELIKEKVAQLEKKGVVTKSVKTMIGLDAPKSLKEKLATINESRELNSGIKQLPKETLHSKASL
jgi:cellobiose-specific phosphotransferase system component IIB